MDVYVFPKDGKGSSKHSKGEADCYEWMIANAGAIRGRRIGRQAEAQAHQ